VDLKPHALDRWLQEHSGPGIQKGLLLAPGDCFGLAQHFRLGFGVSDEWFPRAMERLDELLDFWRRTQHAKGVEERVMAGGP
jgi:hypothetical protein